MTTNKEELQKQADKLRKDLDELEKLINKPEEPKFNFGELRMNPPPIGIPYYTIDESRRKPVMTLVYDADSCDKGNFQHGNFYDTEEHAEIILKNRRIHLDVRRSFWDKLYARAEWDAAKALNKIDCRWYFYFDRVNNMVMTTYLRCEYNPNTIYFKSLKDAEVAMKYVETQYGKQALNNYVTMGLI